jgi:peptidoglycan hydrolase-like protein with peptidoglycan-binding domain
MYRALAEGTRGLDVRQFERNLVDLKLGPVTVDDVFTASTTAATKRWQRSLGLPETGIVEKFRVVYATGPVRIAQQLVRLGRPATGDVLTYTGGTKLVSILASASEIAWATKGTKVTVVLPGGKSLDGVVAAIGAEATSAPGQPDPASPGTGNARISVTVTIADQAGIGALEKSPVDVRYVAQQRENVLTVPVSALLALAEGGYGVEIVDGQGSRIVAVRTGLFAGGRVEISGPGIAEGVAVGIPQ